MLSRTRQALVLLLLALCLSTGATVARAASEKALEDTLARFEKVYEAVSVRMGEAYWAYYTTDDKGRLEGPKAEFAALFADPALKTAVGEWYPKRDELRDPVLRRRVTVWRNMLRFAEVECSPEIAPLKLELEARLGAGAPKPGKEEDEAEEMFLRLMKLRNAKAKELGFPDFATLMLDITETDAAWFDRFTEDLEKATREPYEETLAELRKQTGKETLGFPDLMMLFGQYMAREGKEPGPGEVNRLITETLGALGYRPDTIPKIVDRDMPEGIGGQGFAIRIPDDVRIVVTPNAALNVRLHEIGHATQYSRTRAKWPSLKGYEWCFGNGCSAFDEGMAETFAGFAENEEWLRRKRSLTDAELAARDGKQRAVTALMIRFFLAHCRVEIEAYRNPGKSLSEVRAGLNRSFLLIDADDRPGGMASVITVAYPVYTQNYLLARIVAFTVHRALEKRFGRNYAFDQRVAPFLEKNLFRDGSLLPWRERLMKGLGTDIDVKGFLARYGM